MSYINTHSHVQKYDISTPHLLNLKHNSFNTCHYATYTGAYLAICYRRVTTEGSGDRSPPVGSRGRAPVVWSGLHPCAPLATPLHIQLTTRLLLHKPLNRFASVARVCQRQLAFLVELRRRNTGERKQ